MSANTALVSMMAPAIVVRCNMKESHVKVEILDPNSWANENGYIINGNGMKIRVTDLDGQFVGILVQRGTGYKFIHDRRPEAVPLESNSSAESPLAEFISQSFGLMGRPMELSKLSAGTNEFEIQAPHSGTGHTERVADCNMWLPYAAEHYNLSRNIRDYILIPAPAIFSDLPNTKGDSLSKEEMLRFYPDIGRQMYKTFKGKPTFLEHANKDITKAKGIILDCFIRSVAHNPKYAKLSQLLAFDRTKDQNLVNQILNKQINSYSVGFNYRGYACSICGAQATSPLKAPCSHTKMGMKTYRDNMGRLVFRRCLQANGFESSAVKSPAFVCNIGPQVIDVSRY